MSLREFDIPARADHVEYNGLRHLLLPHLLETHAPQAYYLSSEMAG